MVSDVPCLLDANVVSYLRVTDIDPFAYVGSNNLAISHIVWLELQAGLPITDRKFIGNSGLISRLGNPIIVEDIRTKKLAAEIQRSYSMHQPPPSDPADVAVAACAIVSNRVLVTRNWKHFHYITGLRMIDARLSSGSGDLLRRVGIAECGPDQACCERVRRGMAPR